MRRIKDCSEDEIENVLDRRLELLKMAAAKGLGRLGRIRRLGAVVA